MHTFLRCEPTQTSISWADGWEGKLFCRAGVDFCPLGRRRRGTKERDQEEDKRGEQERGSRPEEEAWGGEEEEEEKAEEERQERRWEQIICHDFDGVFVKNLKAIMKRQSWISPRSSFDVWARANVGAWILEPLF